MFAGPVNDIDKISHQTIIKDSVVQISADTGGKESKSNVNRPLAALAKKENRKYNEQCDKGNRREEIRLSGKHSPGGAVVQGPYQL